MSRQYVIADWLDMRDMGMGTDGYEDCIIIDFVMAQLRNALKRRAMDGYRTIGDCTDDVIAKKARIVLEVDE